MKQDVRNNEGKIVGFIEDRRLCKKVFKKKHFMRKIPGWAFDKQIIEENDFDRVLILDKDENLMYVSQKEDWLTHGVHKNFGYGDQIILPLKYHEVKNVNQPSLI